MTDYFPQVRDLVVRETAARPEAITRATTLFGDLGVDGDDGTELLEAFAREFHVDLSGLDLRRHFGPEAMGCNVFLLPFALIDHLQGGDPHARAGVIPITVDDLVRSAEAGRWVGPATDGATAE